MTKDRTGLRFEKFSYNTVEEATSKYPGVSQMLIMLYETKSAKKQESQTWAGIPVLYGESC